MVSPGFRPCKITVGKCLRLDLRLLAEEEVQGYASEDDSYLPVLSQKNTLDKP